MDNFEFLGPNLPKNIFWGRNFKNLNLDSESISLRSYVHQFLDKTDNFKFLGPYLPKNGFWSRNFKNLSLDSESTSLRSCLHQFSDKTDNFELFCLNLGKLPNYVEHFGSNIVEGIAESWVEAEMSWVEVDGTEWSWIELGRGGCTV